MHGAFGFVDEFASQLATGRVDIVTPGLSRGDNNIVINQYVTKFMHRVITRTFVTGSRKRIERDQIEFAWNIFYQFN